MTLLTAEEQRYLAHHSMYGIEGAVKKVGRFWDLAGGPFGFPLHKTKKAAWETSCRFVSALVAREEPR